MLGLRARRWVLALVPLAYLLLLVACVLGEPEEPGCQIDAECGQGLVCRAGACFRLIGDQSTAPPDASIDAGDQG